MKQTKNVPLGHIEVELPEGLDFADRQVGITPEDFDQAVREMLTGPQLVCLAIKRVWPEARSIVVNGESLPTETSPN
jgi:hypothetical protein